MSNHFFVVASDQQFYIHAERSATWPKLGVRSDHRLPSSMDPRAIGFLAILNNDGEDTEMVQRQLQSKVIIVVASQRRRVLGPFADTNLVLNESHVTGRTSFTDAEAMPARRLTHVRITGVNRQTIYVAHRIELRFQPETDFDRIVEDLTVWKTVDDGAIE